MEYLWIKSLHVIAVIAWMAGMLYLPRLFVYHATTERKSAQSETFKIMERRLMKAIMTPALIVVWASGLYLAISSGFYVAEWFKAKFALVFVMTLIHVWLAWSVKQFATDANVKSALFFRVLNEIPTLGMIVVVILVVVKPFS